MAKTIPGGFLVAFDGIDGVGKSTQLKLIQEELVRAGWDVKTSRNLGGTPIGESLGEVIKSVTPRPPETNLYISAAIQEALIEATALDLQAGKLILMDRSPLSLAAYEIYGSGVDDALARPFVDRGMEALKPDLIIIYTASVETALKRARQNPAAPDYFESKPPDYFEKVARGYLKLAERYGAAVIDATPSLDSVFAATSQRVQEALARRA